MNNLKKWTKLVVLTYILQSAMPMQAGLWDGISSWFSSSDGCKKTLLAVATLGVSYFIYRCCKSKKIRKPNIQAHLDDALDNDSDNDGSRNGPQPKPKQEKKRSSQKQSSESVSSVDEGIGLGLPFMPSRKNVVSHKGTVELAPLSASQDQKDGEVKIQAAALDKLPISDNNSFRPISQENSISEETSNAVGAFVATAISQAIADIGSKHKHIAEPTEHKEESFDIIAKEEADGCPAHTKEDMVKEGYNLVKAILAKQKNSLTVEDVRYVCWYFAAIAEQNYNKLFQEGTFVIEDSPEGLIFNAIKNCTAQYERLSSHFPKRVIGNHYGIDLDNLPISNKHTIVFGQLKIEDERMKKTLQGNSLFYLKPEDKGCKSPLSVLTQEGLIPAIEATKDGLIHGFQFVASNVNSTLDAAYHDQAAWNKEYAPADIRQAWNELVDLSALDQVEKERHKKEFGSMKQGAIHDMIAQCPFQAQPGKKEEFIEKLQEVGTKIAQWIVKNDVDHLELRKGNEVILRLSDLQRGIGKTTS